MSVEATGQPSVGYAYREPGRGYRSVLYFAVLLGAGFAFDVSLGGGVDHLPGWLIASAIIIGLDLLVIYAARSTKTLTVNADRVQIGDEVIARADIARAAPGIDPDLPVLGWLTGAPRGMDGVTVLLHDASEAVIPTRHPDRLLAVLAVAAADPVTVEVVEIRAADDADLPLLAEIDERADALFRISGLDVPNLEFDDESVPAAVFVAGTPPVAFVRLDVVDGIAHLSEVAVIPGSMRQGLGARLIERAVEWAAEQGHPAITLTTFADVGWNGPMYARRGWAELTGALTPQLSRIREQEVENGLDAVGRRIAMRRELL